MRIGWLAVILSAPMLALDPGDAFAAKKKPKPAPTAPAPAPPPAKKEPAPEKEKEAAKKPAGAPAAEADDGRTIQRGERIEFDARLIQGQTAKAGAVYLFERVGSNLRSMVKERKSFKDKIIRPVYPDEGAL